MNFSNFAKMFEIFYHLLFGKKTKTFNLDNQTVEVMPLDQLEKKIEKNIEKKIRENNFTKPSKYSKPNFFYSTKINIIDNEIKLEGFLNQRSLSDLSYKKITIKNFQKGIILFDSFSNEIIYANSYKAGKKPFILCQISNIKTIETKSYIEKEIVFFKEYELYKINLFSFDHEDDIHIEVLIYDKYNDSWRVYSYDNTKFELLIDEIKTKKVKIRFYKSVASENYLPKVQKINSKNTKLVFNPLTYFNPLDVKFLNYEKNLDTNDLESNEKTEKFNSEKIKKFDLIYFYSIPDYFYNVNENILYKFQNNQWFQTDLCFIGFIDDQGFYFFEKPVFELEPFIYKGSNLSIKNVFFDENIKVKLIFSDDYECTTIEEANKYFRIIKNSEKIDLILHSDVYIKQILKNKNKFLKIILERSF